jgi:MoaA/NifB/PqqE/SkfB family radical SAM enzyme
MRFPLRLTADLGLGLAGQAVRGKIRRPLIFRLAPTEEAGRSQIDSEKVSDGQGSVHGTLAGVQNCVPPVAWIGGAEPLLHPQVAHLARGLLDRGRHVFLQTGGNLLRRRIHDFQPQPRLFLTVEFNGMEASHDFRAGRKGAFQAAVEGICTAKLSGFFTCAYTAVCADTSVDELRRLLTFFQTLKMDGWVIVSASGPSNLSMCKREAARQNLAEARLLIPSRRWQLFSKLVEAAATPSAAVEPPVREFARGPRSEPGICDEGIQVQ